MLAELRDFYKKYEGRKMPVLVELKKPNGKYHSTTANYMDIYIDGSEDMMGKTVNVILDGRGGGEIIGDLC